MNTPCFNINDFLPTVSDTASKNTTEEQKMLYKEIDILVNEIESKSIDLTHSYSDWLNIAFAFSNDLGEAGREYFHRISKFYPEYNFEKTNQKYDSCLKTKKTGITIKTFFYLAKQAGVLCADKMPEQKKNPVENKTNENPETTPAELIETDSAIKYDNPLLNEKIYDTLPSILKESCSLFKERIEKDILLLSSLTVLSGCLPKIEGNYFNRYLSPHLYLFITGPSASGKGNMIWARAFGQCIHESKINETVKMQLEYVQQLEEYENLPKTQRSSKPIEPARNMLFIPANTSNSAFIQLLSENNFSGIIFETEADTLSNATSQEWGSYSDILRKGFHHESLSMARRLNNEFFEITTPHLAMCLSGTTNQVHRLMPDVENGLFSRFMFFAFFDNRPFINPFERENELDFEQFFKSKGYEVFHFYEKLSRLINPIRFFLTKKQGQQFTVFFQQLLDKNKTLLTSDLDANIKRLGVISFRIAMTLSALRLMDQDIGKELPSKLICSDQDFETAMSIASTLESHAVSVYQHLPKTQLKGLRLQFYEKLPSEFNRQKYLEVAKSLGINEKTAEKYIKVFCINLLSHGYNSYIKMNIYKNNGSVGSVGSVGS